MSNIQTGSKCILFFSSRRRHTRYIGDWSSDVCSSDLVVSYGNVIASFLPTWVAKEGGIYQKNGLDVDLRLVESAKGIPALLSGETQIADIGGSQILSAAVNGADLMVLTGGGVLPFVLQVPPATK